MRQLSLCHISRPASVTLAILMALGLLAPGEAFAKRAHRRLRGAKAVAAARAAAKAKAAAAAAEEAAPTPTPTPTGEGPGAPAAPEAPPAPVPGDELSVYVITMGPGDHPFFKFGHNAIWIQDRNARTDRVYNFGTFRFDSPKLLPEFIRGKLTYWLSVSSVQQTLRTYVAENRTVEVQELDLDAHAKLDLKHSLDENALPQNRAYKYDYFLDNCSTRVRDAIDAATGGRLRTSAQGPARLTLRAQALRLTADVVSEYLGLYLVLGPSTDRGVDRWAEMFIPQELARGLRAVTLPATAEGQGARPLVKAQQTLFLAKRPPPLEQPPERAVTLLLAGLALALGLFVLGGLAAGQPIARMIFGVVIAIWGLVVGFVGCFLLLVWIGTDHQVVYRNQNILQCAPFAIALVVFGWGVAFGMHNATRKAMIIAFAAAVLSVAGALLSISKISPQDNGPLIAFLLPAWVGVAAGLYNIRRIQTLR
jgi:hypothetical protein